MANDPATEGLLSAFCYRCSRPRLPAEMRTVRTPSGGAVRRCTDCIAGKSPHKTSGMRRRAR